MSDSVTPSAFTERASRKINNDDDDDEPVEVAIRQSEREGIGIGNRLKKIKRERDQVALTRRPLLRECASSCVFVCLQSQELS